MQIQCVFPRVEVAHPQRPGHIYYAHAVVTKKRFTYRVFVKGWKLRWEQGRVPTLSDIHDRFAQWLNKS